MVSDAKISVLTVYYHQMTATWTSTYSIEIVYLLFYGRSQWWSRLDGTLFVVGWLDITQTYYNFVSLQQSCAACSVDQKHGKAINWFLIRFEMQFFKKTGGHDDGRGSRRDHWAIWSLRCRRVGLYFCCSCSWNMVLSDATTRRSTIAARPFGTTQGEISSRFPGFLKNQFLIQKKNSVKIFRLNMSRCWTSLWRHQPRMSGLTTPTAPEGSYTRWIILENFHKISPLFWNFTQFPGKPLHFLDFVTFKKSQRWCLSTTLSSYFSNTRRRDTVHNVRTGFFRQPLPVGSRLRTVQRVLYL